MRLTLFMSRGMSLAGWDKVGMLDREMALYRRLAAEGVDIAILSYGGPEEIALARRVPGIRILYNRFGLPARWYERLAHVIHAPWLARRGVFKTNQITAAGVALRAKALWRNPLIARCGYLWSEARAFGEGADSPGARHALAFEEALFSSADRVVVTTPAIAADIASRVPGCCPTVIPNYVDAELFRPDPGAEKQVDVLFIGRLAPQKNVEVLVEAVAAAGASVIIVGEGPQEPEMERWQARLGDKLRWVRRVPHDQLPSLMNSARVFALPSLFEGHPKALIEAMTCGMTVVGARSSGISDLIRHGETGLLAEPEAISFAQALRQALDQAEQARAMGHAAHETAMAAYGLDRVVEMELAELTAARRGR